MRLLARCAHGVRRGLFIVIALCAAAGCASAPNVYGPSARYSPAMHGYVMAQKDGSDDPSVDATVLLLRDPLTGDKLSCREDVIEWRELYEDVAVDLVDDENAKTATAITMSAVFAPIVAMDPVGALVLAESLLSADGMYDSLRSDTATELLASGIALSRRKRYARSTELIERALAKDPAVGIVDKAYLSLGLGYRELGRDDRAVLALTLFLKRSGVRDVDAYREAESALSEMGRVASPRCESMEPVELHW